MTATHRTASSERIHRLAHATLFVLILAATVYFRLSGLLWGEYQYLHPDERFLVWVGTDISPVSNLSEYFDTANSSLNPHNRGHGFYVYGTLPMFLTRYVVEWVYGQSSFEVMTDAGRSLSALADILTVVLVYLVAKRLYNERTALLAMAFSSAVVLQIQQAHFFTMDTFTTFFSFLAFYFAVLVVTAHSVNEGKEAEVAGSVETSGTEGPSLASSSAQAVESRERTFLGSLTGLLRDPLLLPSLGFGVALGMAVSSKLNAAPMAVVLPAAMVLYLLNVPPKERERRALRAFLFLVMAGAVSLLVFRLFQPYAFSGPGFLGVTPNPQWVQNIRDQRAQSGGDVDFPPAMQWARRPVWFSVQNMVLWGLGLPLGLLAWAGFLWAGWRLLVGWEKDRREWLSHALIWGWTAIYFVWQSLQLNPTMRYQLPIYPTLVIFAAWAVTSLYDLGGSKKAAGRDRAATWLRLSSVLIGGFVLVATWGYAYAFTGLYTRPITRIAASRWIYQNIPGPVTLMFQEGNGQYAQIIPVPYEYQVMQGVPFSANFKPRSEGILEEVVLPRLKDIAGVPLPQTLTVSISDPESGSKLATASVTDSFTESADPRGKGYTLAFEPALQLDPEKDFRLTVELAGESVSIPFDGSGIVTLQSLVEPGMVTQTISAPVNSLRVGTPLSFDFQAGADGLLQQIHLPGLQANPIALAQAPILQLEDAGNTVEVLSTPASFLPDPGGRGFLLIPDQALPVMEEQDYRLTLMMQPPGGTITLNGMGVANEGDWDDGLPLRMDDYDGFGGIYPRELNFNMYWDDNQEKLDRFTRILDESDYLVISSNRQWGSLPRLPERFPMTSLYYRSLLGCPPESTVENCYRVAEPGMFAGELGYELVQVFTSEPRLGPLRLNDQFAEEAFSVYDHPKVLIFKKTGDYDPQKVRDILGQVDFSKVIRVAPMRAADHPLTLMLPAERLVEQQAGGTWSELFDSQAPHNRSQALAVLVWYAAVALLGIIAYPILRLATPGLADHGYPLARVAGLLLLSYLAWLAGSLRIPYTRLTITIILALLLVLSIYLVYRQRHELRRELRQQARYFLLVEGLLLAFFLFFLVVRYGNPDLWHPWKGGEKPMDFAYFNAVLKSTTFPPYDPWYAGGYLNYYYYGFVLVGTLVKWLGINPAVAYNLILPTIFSLIAMGAFSLTWNLVRAAGARRDRGKTSCGRRLSRPGSRRWQALLGWLYWVTWGRCVCCTRATNA